MKEVKSFVIADFVLFLVKGIGGFLCHSYTMMASGLYDLVLVLSSCFLFKKKENKKYKGILSALWGFFIILSGLGIVFWSEIAEIEKTSLFVLLFLLVSLIIRYVVSCYFTNTSYQKKKGLLSFGVIHSTVDFYNYGVILVALVLMKMTGWFSIFRYADRLGTICIVALLVIKGIKIIFRSFRYLEEKVEDVIGEEIKEEIVARTEVKKLDTLQMSSYGGLHRVDCAIQIHENVRMLDVNTFVVTLQDYLLKIADVVKITLVDKKAVVKKKPKVRSLKQDARNSGSRNSKTNAKKKNTKQKNKKR